MQCSECKLTILSTGRFSIFTLTCALMNAVDVAIMS